MPSNASSFSRSAAMNRGGAAAIGKPWQPAIVQAITTGFSGNDADSTRETLAPSVAMATGNDFTSPGTGNPLVRAGNASAYAQYLHLAQNS